MFHFQRDPAALGGLMRMHLCHLALGQAEKASAAVERARALRKQIDPAKLSDARLALSGELWDDWLAAVGKLDPVVISRNGQ